MKKTKNKSMRSFTGLLLAIGIASSVAVPVRAAETYTVETREMHTIKNSTEGTRQVDYVINPNGGPVLGLLHDESGENGANKYILQEEDGGYIYAFKDMNKNGVLDPYEDWRLDSDTRANDLANSLASTDEGIAKIAGLMLFSSHESKSEQGLTDAQIEYLDGSYVRNITDAAGNNVSDAVGWSNEMQAYVEESDFNVPVNFSSDPRSTAGSGDLYSPEASESGISAWPSNLGLAATFSVSDMQSFARASSAEYRSMGIATALGPQIDLATEPRWLRVGGTFGENAQLTADMTSAYVNGSQSTYSPTGEDLGWGHDSIVTMIKHFPGDGAGEGGRESHTQAGKYAVYPGNNFDEHLIPFKEGLNLTGKTKHAGAVMTSYSIGINADGTPVGGEDSRVGSAYNYVKMAIIRDQLGYDGVICTDWGVTEANDFFGMAWGAESLSEAERHFRILEAGSDMFGGNNEGQPIVDAFAMFKEKYGEETARARYAASAKRLIKLTMDPGLFENPYLDKEESLAIAGSVDKKAAGYETQLNSIVMLKNENETIQPSSKHAKPTSDMKVYIPMSYSTGEDGIFGSTPAHWLESISLDTARSIYGEVITDELQEDGTYAVPDLSDVDLVIVGMRTPNNGGLFSNTGMTKNEDGSREFYPLSLQYRPYTADSEFVRRQSIAGDKLADGSQENRSYYGKTSKISNEYDLDAVQNAVDAVEQTGKEIPIVVTMNASGPAIVSEFEKDVDAILVGFSVSDQALFDTINGAHEPKGLLPMQFPRDMESVEAQLEDVGQDVTPYLDSQGNTYDFAYGLNWSGIISDERVAKYNPNRPDTLVDTLSINANDFSLTYEEAKDITEELLISKADVKAELVKANTITKENSVITISVDEESLNKVKNIEEAGGNVDVTFTATSKNLSVSETVSVDIAKKLVKGEEVKPPVTTTPSKDGNKPNTGVENHTVGYIAGIVLAVAVIGGVTYTRKRKTEN